MARVLRYFARLTAGRIILWCYRVWKFRKSSAVQKVFLAFVTTRV